MRNERLTVGKSAQFVQSTVHTISLDTQEAAGTLTKGLRGKQMLEDVV